MTPERVALMRHVRRLIRAGRSASAIRAATGADYAEIAGQRRLMTLCDGGHASDVTTGAHQRAGMRRVAATSVSAAETTGDLVDILNAPVNARDIAYWMRGD